MKLAIFLRFCLFAPSSSITAFSLSPKVCCNQEIRSSRSKLIRLSTPTDDDSIDCEDEKNNFESNKEMNDEWITEDEPNFLSVPIFTGTIITVLSTFLTAYFFYAGLTGHDPLFQQN
mmetsp:Transcript_2103/g.3015  ORF Transcript_2103/g.3015 Transcript_2103/m.3015 type:complete len:117 (-) Transcript_2103:79-429(-)